MPKHTPAKRAANKRRIAKGLTAIPTKLNAAQLKAFKSGTRKKTVSGLARNAAARPRRRSK